MNYSIVIDNGVYEQEYSVSQQDANYYGGIQQYASMLAEMFHGGIVEILIINEDTGISYSLENVGDSWVWN